MKYLSVPVNQMAMKRLDYDSCADGDLREVSLSNQEFKELWVSGILDKFNEELNIMIDDFENESIKDTTNLSLAKKLTLDSIMEHPNVHVLRKLLSQIELAEEFQTGLFFIFRMSYLCMEKVKVLPNKTQKVLMATDTPNDYWRIRYESEQQPLWELVVAVNQMEIEPDIFHSEGGSFRRCRTGSFLCCGADRRDHFIRRRPDICAIY